jgi:hypothetical protein
MKNEQDGAQGQGRSQTENLDATGELPANNNGHETAEPRQEIAAELQGKRTVSSRKVAANRRNAQKSTGPRTPAGKKRVSRNALRHGFYSKWLLVPHRDGNESQAEYDESNTAIHEHYQPVGWLEERWVETIAVWSWRLRRVIRYETGQIARALAEHSDDLRQSREADSEPYSVASSNPEMEAMTDHLFLTSEGLENQMRYEALINRMLNHAIAELERIQTLRK